MTSVGVRHDRKVRKAAKALEEAGCRVRVKDGGHFTLYPPDGVDGPTLRVSASRPAEETLHFMRTQFAAPICLDSVLP
jgi:hypothetical protein